MFKKILIANRGEIACTARVLGESIDFARQGQLALRDPAFKPTVPIVNIPPPPAAKP